MKTSEPFEITRDGFTAWLDGQHPERRFNFTDTGRCAVASYATEAMGLRDVCCGSKEFFHGPRLASGERETIPVPNWLQEAFRRLPTIFTVHQLKSTL